MPVIHFRILSSCLASFVLELEFNSEAVAVTGSEWGEEELEEKDHRAGG